MQMSPTITKLACINGHLFKTVFPLHIVAAYQTSCSIRYKDVLSTENIVY